MAVGLTLHANMLEQSGLYSFTRWQSGLHCMLTCWNNLVYTHINTMAVWLTLHANMLEQPGLYSYLHDGSLAYTARHHAGTIWSILTLLTRWQSGPLHANMLEQSGLYSHYLQDGSVAHCTLTYWNNLVYTHITYKMAVWPTAR